MERYVAQLLEDIAFAAAQPDFPFVERSEHGLYWISMEDEDRRAPLRRVDEWTGIAADALPPEKLLNDGQLHALLEALKGLLEAYNCLFVLQIEVPERIQYETIRLNFSQEVKVRTVHMGFFEFCVPGTPHETCAMGSYCHCAFFERHFGHLTREDLSPEEERLQLLQWEIERLKRKYDDDWMKYYPYHLDPEYDDEDGNPYDYGWGDDGDDDDDDDDWWRR